MIDIDHLKDYIITPALHAINMYSESAMNLLAGTCAKESRLGTYFKQLGGGPALGIYQMEPATYNDIFDNYLSANTKYVYRERMYRYIGWKEDFEPPKDMLIYNLGLATCMARLHYSRFSEPLPHKYDVEGLAAYWKKYYNTPEGAGTQKEFINDYIHLVQKVKR